MNKIFTIFLFLTSFGSQMVMSEPRVNLEQGSLFIAGALSLNYQLSDFSSPEHRFSLGSDIGGGFFVVDNFAVGGSLPTQWTFVPKATGVFGLSLFGTYFFDLATIIFPYLGLNINPSYSLAAEQFLLNTGVDCGLLVSLSESVALDLGIAPKIQVALNAKQKWSLAVPAGFLGVRAFF